MSGYYRILSVNLTLTPHFLCNLSEQLPLNLFPVLGTYRYFSERFLVISYLVNLASMHLITKTASSIAVWGTSLAIPALSIQVFKAGTCRSST